MTNEIEAFFATNRANWNERVGIHLNDQRGIYRLAELRDGADVLGPIESRELGSIAGKRVLHLQCHFGVDTICLARRGATVTGVDFAQAAVIAARALAAELGVSTSFVEGNVYDAPTLVGDAFDAVYTSWGTIGWLPDIGRWAKAVAACLKEGGFLYMADGHPTLYQLEERAGRLEVTYDWRTPADTPIAETLSQSYAGDGRTIENVLTYGWNHPVSDILGALGDAGLRVEYFHEHEMIPWQAFASMRREGAMFVQAEGQPRVPLAFSLRATKG